MSVYRPRDKEGRPKSPFWFYDFQIGGVRFHGSTRETERRKAEAVERREREKAKAELAAESKVDRSTIAAVFARFWEEKGRHDSDSDTTFYRMERLQDGLAEILGKRGRPLVLAEIGDDIIAAYVARRRGQKSRHGRLLSPSSINREVQILRRIMRRANGVWKLRFDMPAWGALLNAEPEERVVDLPLDVEDRIIANLREEFRPAARFLILSGLRRENAIALHPGQVDFVNDTITVQMKSKKPGGRRLVLPITQPMREILANELAHQHPDAVFTFICRRANKTKGYARGLRYPINADWFYREFKSAAAAAGIPDFRVHDLRHTAATRTLRKTKNLRIAQAQLGHTRIATTTKYAHVLLDDLREALEQVHHSAAQKLFLSR